MIDTEGSRGDLLADDHPMRHIARHIPLGRVGAPDDVVKRGRLPRLPRSGHITGAHLVVDGGWSTVLPGSAT